VSPERVQHALLKIMEGATVRLDDGRHVDTTGILFMCAGAFVGLEKLVAQGDVYGFIATSGDDNRRILDRLNRRVKPTDLVRFGLIPEFTGRLPIVARFRDLAKADLVRVMTEPRDSIHAQFRALFHQEGVELVVAPAVFEQIAEIALGYETGARSLRGLLEELLSPALYVVADDRSVRAVLISSIYDEPRIVRRPVQPTDRTSLDRSRDVAAVDAGAA
jgi:ATP-dependent Clp protease ATP-binding subunit ClpX